ncbi:MAG: WYL domain-containing protein [Helicobacteraceae bacterium]|nr:WYL domain-containing protein [Helicobacteraceae bacterium]
MYDDTTIEKVTKLFFKGGKYTTKALAIRFNKTTRNIQYIIKELQAKAGLEKEGTSYYIPDKFRNLEIYERVHMSTSLMLSLYKHAIPNPQISVQENFKELPKETDIFIFDINFEEIKNETFFNQIANAIINNVAIKFEYKNKRDIVSIKNVYPIKITNLLGYWYLMSYDLEDEKVKTFYLNTITNLSTLDESYLDEKKMKKLQLESSQMKSPWYCDNIKNVELKVTGDAILYIQRQNSDVFEIINDEDSFAIFINMKYYNDVEVLSFVKKWLPFIYIVNNEPLQQKLEETFLTYSKNNN